LAVATSADVIDWTLGRRDPLAEVVAGTSDFAEAPDPYAELAVDAAGLLLGMRSDQRAFAGVYGDLAPPVALEVAGLFLACQSSAAADGVARLAALGGAAVREVLGARAPGLAPDLGTLADRACADEPSVGVRLALAAGRAVVWFWEQAMDLGSPHRALGAAASAVVDPGSRRPAELRGLAARARAEAASAAPGPARLAACAAAAAVEAAAELCSNGTGRASLESSVADALALAAAAFGAAGLEPALADARVRHVAVAEVRALLLDDGEGHDPLQLAGAEPAAHASGAPHGTPPLTSGTAVLVDAPGLDRGDLEAALGAFPDIGRPRPLGAPPHRLAPSPDAEAPSPPEPGDLVFDDDEPHDDDRPPAGRAAAGGGLAGR